MGLEDFLKEIKEEVSTVVSPNFNIEITDANIVPSTNDPGLTFANLDTKTKKCKSYETCVLYIDLRNSTTMSLTHYPKTLAKMYSVFVRSMVRSAEYFGGRVRNIIGDRVMVLFERKDCFQNAVNTAFLLNTVSSRILNKQFKNNTIKCGIGIDYGKMLIVKAGTVKQGNQREFGKSLVWLGRPANIASKLTDLANKSSYFSTPGVHVGNYYPYTQDWHWYDQELDEFVSKLSKTVLTPLTHEDKYFTRIRE